jgi:cyclophilin family peptidyl-prolyl cis-trans isomerase
MDRVKRSAYHSDFVDYIPTLAEDFNIMITKILRHGVLNFTLLSLSLGFTLPAHSEDTAEISPTTPKKESSMVHMQTNQGLIVIELDAEKAPLSTKNFTQYVEDGFYDGLIFHRVINNFMIQGGGYDKDYKEAKTRAPIQNEAKNGLKNDKYTIAMARTSDPHSGTAQFFINVGNNGFLDYPGQDGWGYAVFGKVVEGKEVVDKIKDISTGSGGIFPTDVPQTMVIIEKATVVK